MNSFFRIYLLPGVVFQSLVVAGGYGTGADLVEYFLRLGPISGLMGLAVAMLTWSAVCIICFVLAVKCKTYDYFSFFSKILGKLTFLYDLYFVYLILLVLSVIATSMSYVLNNHIGVPVIAGQIIVLSYLGIFAMSSQARLEKMFSVWSFVLYGIFILTFIYNFSKFGVALKSQNIQEPSISIFNGLTYAFYNLAAIPAMLFTLRKHENTKQAVGAGLLSGFIAVVPAFLLFLSLTPHYPEILNKPLPYQHLFSMLDAPLLYILYSIVLMGTMIETGVGLLSAFFVRVQKFNFKVKHAQYISLSLILITALSLAQFGLINLIAKGYTTLALLMILFIIIPLFRFLLKEKGKLMLKSSPNQASCEL